MYHSTSNSSGVRAGCHHRVDSNINSKPGCLPSIVAKGDFYKSGAYRRSGRVCAKAWDLFRRKASRVDRGRHAAGAYCMFFQCQTAVPRDSCNSSCPQKGQRACFIFYTSRYCLGIVCFLFSVFLLVHRKGRGCIRILTASLAV